VTSITFSLSQNMTIIYFRLVVNLWCPKRRSGSLGIPNQLILGIQGNALVSDRQNLARVLHLLCADTHLVSRDPE
jgi:hypothetical protein